MVSGFFGSDDQANQRPRDPAPADRAKEQRPPTKSRTQRSTPLLGEKVLVSASLRRKKDGKLDARHAVVSATIRHGVGQNGYLSPASVNEFERDLVEAALHCRVGAKWVS